ncbi:hypothetical protein [Chroococcidiopsis sp.]|uniref:hypothetical protein n=1 Tax=Chroococcidiopsis sp. TaxID=3088168 RepID=UPI003F3BD2E9
MLRLPFKSEPKPTTVSVGDEEIGILEFPKLYDLTPNERLFIKEAMKDIPDVRFEGIKLAKEFALASGTPVSKMYVALTTGDAETLGEHLEAMLHFQERMEKSGEKRITATVTALIKYRIFPDWTEADTDDIEQLPPKLRSRIYEFSQKEASGWRDEPPIELTEEDLGKSRTALSTESQIGENSTGDLESSAPTKNASTKKTLAASPAG